MLADATESLRPSPENVTVSVTPTLAAKWLTPGWASTGARTQIRRYVCWPLSGFRTFFSDNVDLAVRYGRPPFGPGLNVELLFEERLIAVASPPPTGAKSPVQLHSDTALVLLQDSQSSWDEFLAYQGLTPNKSHKSLWFN